MSIHRRIFNVAITDDMFLSGITVHESGMGDYVILTPYRVEARSCYNSFCHCGAKVYVKEIGEYFCSKEHMMNYMDEVFKRDTKIQYEQDSHPHCVTKTQYPQCCELRSVTCDHSYSTIRVGNKYYCSVEHMIENLKSFSKY